ncbi:MAG: ribosome maturation factor RimP [Rhodocyclaceae bacterium]|nr:ribosome maturation factor RimP [Rhodocyclaceae bacterium]
MADLVGLIEQAVNGLGFELVEFETSPRARLLRVYIDRLPEEGTGLRAGGITVDDCAVVSNHLTHLFAVEHVDYDRLEVSSPGLDRPLKKAADYQRFAGQEVQLKLRIPEGKQRNFSGTIVGLIDDRVQIATEDGAREFTLDNIERARLVPKF